MDAATVGDGERGAATADDAEFWRQTARAKEAEFAELAAGSAELEALLEAELDTVTKHAEELSAQLQASNAAADAERERSAELQAELHTAKQHASEWRTRVASAETALERAEAAARASAAEVESLRASLEAAQEEAVMYALELDKGGDSGGDSDSGGGGASPLPLTVIGEQERANSTPTEFASRVHELEAEIACLKRRQLQPTSPTASPSEGEGRAKRAALGASLEEERSKCAALGASLEEERSKCAALGASLEEERSKCAALGASLEEERDKCDQLSEEMEELTETLVARNSLEVELRTAQQTIATLQATTPRAPSPPSRVNDGQAKVTAAPGEAGATRSSDGLALMSAQRCEALEKACAAAAAEVKEVRQAHRTAAKEVKELRQAHRTAAKEVKELRQAQRTSAAQVNKLKQQLRQSQARLLVRRNSRSGGGGGGSSSSGSLVAHATPPRRKSSGATEPTPRAPGSAPARASVATIGTQTVVGTPSFEAAAVSDVALTGRTHDTQVTPHVPAALGAEIASLRRSLKTMHAATLSLHECRSASALTPAAPRCDKAPAPAPLQQQLQLQQAPATGSASGSLDRLAAVAGSGGTQPEARSLATTPATRGSEQHLRPQVVRLATQVRQLRRALGVLRAGCTEFMREGNAVLQRRLPAKAGAGIGSFAEQQAAGSTDTGEAAAMAELAADNERLRRRLRHATSVRSAPREGAAQSNTIGVYVRVRPRSQAEREARDHTAAVNGASKQRHDGERPVSIISDTELAFYDARARMWRPFAFDGVFGPAATQQHLFEEVEALASGAVDGFHGCVLAFGQTGSGKTYSMEGKRAEAVGVGGGDLHNHGVDEGLSYRLASHIFRVIASRHTEASGGVADGSGVAPGENSETTGVASSGEADPEAAYIVRVSMVEIYNEQLRDLLAGWPTTTTTGMSGDARHPNDGAHNARSAAGAPTTPRLQIRQSAGRSNGGAAADSVHVTGLTQVRVNSVADVRNVLAHGNDARAVASTNVHEHSSRSHSIVQIEVSHRSPGEAGMTSLGRLSLVDLAGSERLRKSHATGDRLVEARHINKSLSALGDVLEALDRKASHVPYRNSCLTRLLQDSLGGRSSRTVMLATVAPTVSAAEETMFTLQFAARARHIDLGPVRRAVRYKNLNATVRKLRRELASSEQERRRLADRLQAAERDASVADRRTSESIDRVRRAEADERRAASARIEALRSNVSELTARLRTAKTDRAEREADMRALHKRLDAERHTSASLRRQSATLEARVAALQRKLHRQSGQSGSPAPRPNARTAVVPPARASEDGPGGGSADASDADNLALAASGHTRPAQVEVGGLGRAAEASGQPGQLDAGLGSARDRADSSGGNQSLTAARAAVALSPARADADVASGSGSGATPRRSDVGQRPVGRPRPSTSTQAVPGTRTRSRRDRSSAGAGTSGGRRSTKKDKSKRKPGWRF